MTDFHALCAELADALSNAIRVIHHEDGTLHISTAEPVLDRARAALAEPQPEPPTDEELLSTYGLAKRDHNYEGPIDDWPRRAERAATVAGLRAVLARWGRPAPADGKAGELAEELRRICFDVAPCDADIITRAADLLERLIPPQPIPVSERLPGPEDRNGDGECWAWRRFDPEGDMDNGDLWCLAFHEWLEDEDCGFTHWLPAHALPLP